MQSIRDAFGEALVEAGKDMSNVVAVSCDLSGATRTSLFKDVYPERFFEVGISEAHGIGLATGLALGGYRPFISSFGAFITGKNVEIRTSIAYNEAPVVVVGTHGGLIGPDGATQAGLQDISIMRSIPGFKVYQPCCPLEMKQIVKHVARSRDMVYIRCSRNKVPDLVSSIRKFEPGVGYKILDREKNQRRTIISSGPMVYNAMAAASEVNDVSVVNIPSINPIDEELIWDLMYENDQIFVIEDHSRFGGLGSAVCEVAAARRMMCPITLVGLDDFIVSGKPAELEKHYRLDKEGILCLLS
jgi:transketolase